ncbi:MAG: hypothetical protein IJO24_06220 [Clostridia bacterium]|nr:hypothetical protein [Clostridia bacterium]
MITRTVNISSEQLAAIIQANIAIDDIIEGNINADIVEELKEINPIIADFAFNAEETKKNAPVSTA